MLHIFHSYSNLLRMAWLAGVRGSPQGRVKELVPDGPMTWAWAEKELRKLQEILEHASVV